MAVKVCLDAGHYGKYNRSPAVSSYYESDMTWKLHNYLKKELEAFGIDVVTTRTNQNTDRALYERGAASKGCNLFISVHSNATGNDVNESVDYPVAYVLLNGSSTDIGLKLAKVVESVMGTAQSGRTATRQGTNGEYYGVLRGANTVGTPGIILEHSFHTNTRATKWLSSDSNLQKLTKAEAECIASYYRITKKEETTFTKIMGNAVAMVEQMSAYIKAKNPDVAQSVVDMIPLYLSEGKAEGVRGDIAFAQSCLETGNLGFSGSAVTLDQNNFCGIRKKFERGEVMITTSRFLGYDKNEYGDLIVNRKEAEIVSLTFALYLMNVGSSRIGELLDYLGVKTVTGTTWESVTINGMLCNEKYKGDFHLQKYYTPENKRNHTRKNNGEVQSYYISENHEPIVSPEVWERVQEVREQRKRDRNIGQDNTMKFQNRYPLSRMLICPYCGKTLRRRQVYKKKIQWLCSTYIEKGVKACKGIRIDDAELQGLNITEQTVIEEVVKNGKKHYCYTSKEDFDCGIRNSTVGAEIEDGSVLPSVNRPRRTVIKL